MNGSIINKPTGKIGYLSHSFEIGKIIEQVGGINDNFCELATPHLQFLCEYFGIKPNSAALFAALVNLYKGKVITFPQLSAYVKLDTTVLLTCRKEFEELEDKKLLQICKGRIIPFPSLNRMFLRLPDNISDDSVHGRNR